MSYYQDKPETLERVQWLIKLRWVAVTGTFVAICVAEALTSSGFFIMPYCLGAVLIACYNLAFSLYAESLSLNYDEKKATKFANLQVSLDLTVLTYFVYLSGGAESPFISFFVFHMITASILLSTKSSYLQAGLATSLCSFILIGEYLRFLPHWNLTILRPNPYGFYLEGRVVAITILELTAMLFLTAYLTNYLAGLLREKQEGIKELSRLLKIGKLLGSTLKLDTILNIILDTAVSETRTTAGSVVLFDEKKDELTLRVARGFSKPFLNKTSSWKIRKGGMTDMILKEGKPFVIGDTSKSELFKNPVAIKEGIKSLIAVPLFTEDRVVGIIYVDDFKPRNFTKSEVRLVSLFATQAAVAVNNAQLHEKTKELAITDGLTKVFNHRHFRETLENEIIRADRYHHPLSLTMMDIDCFKKYNDIYGHFEGDVLLKDISDLLKRYTREMDFVARYGGDEFVIISPETDKERAVEMAERIRVEVVESFFGSEEAYKSVTMSLGVASFPTDAVSVDDLIKKADAALYKAKRAKRNKVCAFVSVSKTGA
ncbi:MAG TPA: sensor domain-containing diguanylate cyclase [Actinobacteria bacterium]|nr:sensor domain-containing diguanylate cyclase [Actinomycetota bacterium]